MEDIIFIQLVSQIAARHGCKIKDVDFNTKNIDLDCPTQEQTEACAWDLEREMSQYTV